jgi:hypothetical protein
MTALSPRSATRRCPYVFVLMLTNGIGSAAASDMPRCAAPLLAELPSDRDVLLMARGSRGLGAVELRQRRPSAATPIHEFTEAEFVEDVLPGVAGEVSLVAQFEHRLLAYSASRGTLALLRPKSGERTILVSDGLPSGLQALEVSTRGLAVLADFAADATRLFVVDLGPKLDTPKNAVKSITLGVKGAGVAFSPTGLLILSSETKAVLEMPSSALEAVPDRSRLERSDLTPVFSDLPEAIVTIAAHDDLVYLAGGSDVLVAPRQMPRDARFARIPTTAVSIASIRAYDDYMVITDAEGRSSLRLKPVPMTMTFTGDALDTAGRLLQLYEILRGDGLLPTRRVPIGSANAIAALIASRALPPVAAHHLSKTSADLLRRLNPGRVDATPPSDEPTVLPEVALSAARTTVKVQLNGRPAERVLRERLLPEQTGTDREIVASVLQANRSLQQTLDAALFRMDVVPIALGTPALRLGTALQLTEDGFNILGACEGWPQHTAVRRPPEATGFGLAMTTRTVGTLALDDDKTAVAEVRLDKVSIESTSFPADESGVSRQVSIVDRCRAAQPAATHVLTDVVRAGNAFIRWRAKDGTLVYPDRATLRRAGFGLSPSRIPEWSAFIEEPFLVGIRTTPLVPGAGTDWPTAVLKRVLSVTQGSLNLPVTTWECAFAAPRTAAGDSTPLRKLESREPLVRLSVHEGRDAPSRPSSRLLRQPEADAQDTEISEVERRNAGRDLRGLLHYPANPPDASAIIIALAEHQVSADTTHPDFARPGSTMSVWYERKDDQIVPTSFGGTPRAQGAATFRRDFKQEDHATHIAGLLAASVEPAGLAPGVGLILIDSSRRPDDVAGDLKTVSDLGIAVVNFSQTYEYSQTLQEQLGDSIIATNQLIVAAAGNKHRHLKSALVVPIGWSDGPHVIGVGAADQNGRICKTSDYGKAYVQLLAPGHDDVLSRVKNGRYGRTGGASQAAAQVTAAAALINAQNKTIPSLIKARLIATADWAFDYENLVWGGLLNVERAVSSLDSNVLTLLPDGSTAMSYSIAVDGQRTVTLKRSLLYSAYSDAASPDLNARILWTNVLRITRQHWLPAEDPNRDRYRVAYLAQQRQLLIRKNVEFTDQKLPVKQCTPPNESASCFSDFFINQIHDYVAAFPKGAEIVFRAP